MGWDGDEKEMGQDRIEQNRTEYCFMEKIGDPHVMHT